MLSADSLVAGYRKDDLLIDDVSFELQPKTKNWIKCASVDVARLFMSIVLGRIRPIRGALKVMDKRPYLLTSASIPHYMKNLGLFWHGAPLIADATVRENLFWKLVAIGETRHKSFIESALALFGLKSVADVKVQILTQSERAKLALARAVIARPPLVIALEPMSDFDASFAERILRILGRMTLLGCTVIVVSAQNPPLSTSFQVIKLGKRLKT